MNQKCINFAIQLTKNIEDIKIFVGEFSKLTEFVDSDHIIFKEHPCNRHYQGKEVPREWMSSITGFYPSFFSLWKNAKRNCRLQKIITGAIVYRCAGLHNLDPGIHKEERQHPLEF